jgi:hypothetical protein
MFYYIYQIKNKLNGKIYIGVHKTTDIDDGYMGSGSIICSAIEKYGIENFEKTILETFKNSKEMFEREKEIVTEEFLTRSDVYNLRRGGSGGFDYINKKGLQKLARKKSNKTMSEKYGDNFLSQIGKKGTEVQRKNGQLEKSIERLKKYPGFKTYQQKNNAHNAANSQEAKLKRKETFKKIGHSQGEKNSQHDTIWITNNFENKKIKKSDIIPEGWKKGRVIKKSNLD